MHDRKGRGRRMIVSGVVLVVFACAGGVSSDDARAAERRDRPMMQPQSSTTAAPVAISPGEDIQARVNAHRAGTTFLLKAGVHRLQTLRPRDGDTFRGEPGAVLSGARQLTAFARSGRYWVADGQTQQGPAHGQCQREFPRCRLPEQLFIDDQLLRHVDALEAVGPGTWYFDYAADRIYLGDDPTGRRVETSVTRTAVAATGARVTIEGLIVEKYANLAQHGAITAAGQSGWVIAGNEVRWNHGLGIGIGTGAQVRGNHVHHNGQLGIGGGWGSGVDVLVEGNEIAYNNTAHFDASWEAGGAKFAGTTRLTVRRNTVHHNGGPGLWTDTDNLHTVYEHNTSDDNERMGIFHEISYAAVIRHNTVRRNGFGMATWIWGAGILVAASPNVEVYGNRVEGNADGIGAVQQNRGAGAHGPYQLQNLHVHDNIVVMTHGWTGLVQDIGDTSYFLSRNNRFERNQYELDGDGRYFMWLNTPGAEAEWKRHKQDAGGTFARVKRTSPAAPPPPR